MRGYNRRLWFEFRREVIRLDGGACAQCRRGEADGVILQVHHTRYIPDRLPWEYPYDLCQTLCRGCHAREHGKLPPSVGWDYVGDHDLGDLDGTCELCGTSIRYVFFVQHKQWPSMEVGEICCDNLTSTKLASDRMESLRRYTERCKRFAGSKRWKVDPAGTWSIRQKGLSLDIVPITGAYRLRMNGVMGKFSYSDVLAAKMKAFEAIEDGTALAYLKRKSVTGRRHRTR